MKIFKNLIQVSQILIFVIVVASSCSQTGKDNKSEILNMGDKIVLSEAQMQLANIKIAQVGEGNIEKSLLLTGVIKVNEQSGVGISSRTAGRIEKLYFKTAGEEVNPGDSLYSFYSDDLVAAEREYFTLQSANWNFNGQYPPSLILENKMLFLGMLPDQLTQFRKDGKILFTVTIMSQVKGIVRSVNVTEGQYVEAGEKLFDLAGDNTLWIDAQAYADELRYLKEGMEASVIVPYAGNKEIKTKISFINPVFEPGKNITLVRTEISNKDNNLHPGMLALLKVNTERGEGIVIPESSIIYDNNGNKVWVRGDDGAFSVRNVVTGLQSADSVLVISGLEKSEMVVTSGVYLLNSELVLKNGSVGAGM